MSDIVLDLTALRNAIASLADALDVVGDVDWFDIQSAKIKNTLIAGAIQNFEFVYELSIKMLKRQMEIDSSSPGEIDRVNFRDMLRMGGEKGLIEDVEAWFRYRQMRNVTAHTYDHDKAVETYQGIVGFLSDARGLLACLEARRG